MRRAYLTTLITSLLVIGVFALIYGKRTVQIGTLKVGFIYEGDESTPYTYNFALAEQALKETYPDRVEVYSKSNVREEDTEAPALELIQKGCEIIFTNGYSEQIKEMAYEHPEVQFCQASYRSSPDENAPENYHTFKGRIYEGRYVSGIAAGLKLNEMIDNRVISRDEALVGYVAAYPTDEVISGFTAFILGVRSVCPDAVMHVRYTQSWSSYSRERSAAEQLIADGCRIIGQHSDTIGPALACEDAITQQSVYHIGYNTGMLEVAPSSSITGTCINWTPYIVGAVDALLQGDVIERHVEGTVNGNDIGAGFELDWVEMLELNNHIAAHGTEEQMEKAIENLKKGKIHVFSGDYIGVDRKNENDVIDLNKGYEENSNYSSPSFHYILKDVVIEDN